MLQLQVTQISNGAEKKKKQVILVFIFTLVVYGCNQLKGVRLCVVYKIGGFLFADLIQNMITIVC